MMIFFSDEYADLFNHSRNKQYSSSAALSDNDLEDMIANPYGYTPGEDSVRTDAQLTTGQTPLDIQSTGTLFSSYGEKSVQEILGNAMNPNASIAASSSQSLQQMTDYAASFASSGRGVGATAMLLSWWSQKMARLAEVFFKPNVLVRSTHLVLAGASRLYEREAAPRQP